MLFSLTSLAERLAASLNDDCHRPFRDSVLWPRIEDGVIAPHLLDRAKIMDQARHIWGLLRLAKRELLDVVAIARVFENADQDTVGMSLLKLELESRVRLVQHLLGHWLGVDQSRSLGI